MNSESTIILDKKLIKLCPNETHDKKTISYSQYSKYIKCPKSWELRYIHKHYSTKESVDLVFGQAMHTTIQKWLHVLYSVSVKKANEMDLSSILLTNMKSEYSARMEKSPDHFSSSEQLASYYSDGVSILNYLKKKRTLYFTTKKFKLAAIEYPVQLKIHPDFDILLNGFLDLIFIDETDNSYLIIDIKTSARGWNDYKKKDTVTTDQILVYKKFLCSLLGVDINKINVTYLILKRKLNEDSLWPQKRVQEFSPSNGKLSLSRVEKQFKQFIEECFNKDGSYNTERKYPAFSGIKKMNCLYCPYNTQEDLCPSSNRIENV